MIGGAGLQLTMTQVILRLVRELGCVKSWVIVKNRQVQPRGICSKKKKKKRLLATGQATVLLHHRAREEGGRGAQFAPNQTDQSGVVGAQRGSSYQKDLIK